MISHLLKKVTVVNNSTLIFLTTSNDNKKKNEMKIKTIQLKMKMKKKISWNVKNEIFNQKLLNKETIKGKSKRGRRK